MATIINAIGLTVSSVTCGTINIPVNTNFDYILFEGTSTLTANLNISPSGSPLSDMFLSIKYKSNFTIGSNTIHIFGELLPSGLESKDLLITCYYNGTSWEVSIYEDTDGTYIWYSGTGSQSVYLGSLSGSTASGNNSINVGFDSQTSGDYAFNAGYQNTASGLGATTLGIENVASAEISTAIGAEGIAFRKGQITFSSDSHHANPIHFSQKSFLNPLTSTNTATPGILLQGYTDRLTIANNSIVFFRGNVTAIQQGGTAGAVGDVATWVFQGAIKNIAGTTSLVRDTMYQNNTGAWSSTTTQFMGQPDTTAWSITVTADDTNDCLQIQVTGETDRTIWWTGDIEFNETNLV